MRGRREHRYSVYILGSLNGTLYTGVTSNLSFRVRQHKEQAFRGVTATYGSVTKAFAREKELKGWLREKKIALIEKDNPHWRDLSRGWYDKPVRTTFQG